MNTTNISFSELVKAVSNGKSYIKKHFDIDNTFYTTTIKVNEFKLDTYQNEVAVFKHIPTSASVRVKVLHPFIDNKVEKVEIMPKGKKNYVYVADYIMFEDGFNDKFKKFLKSVKVTKDNFYTIMPIQNMKTRPNAVYNFN